MFRWHHIPNLPLLRKNHFVSQPFRHIGPLESGVERERHRADVVGVIALGAILAINGQRVLRLALELVVSSLDGESLILLKGQFKRVAAFTSAIAQLAEGIFQRVRFCEPARTAFAAKWGMAGFSGHFPAMLRATTLHAAKVSFDPR